MPKSVLLYLITTGLFCIILFLHGFFPMKTYDGTIATKKNLPHFIHETRVNVSDLYAPSIGRLVIMVIDALRWDFVADSGGNLNMPYTASLIEGKKAFLLKGKARPPTVTMPRIKAMTTGTVPNFVDIALNLGSSKIVEDNFLMQAQRNNKKLIFYGDETWQKLFPNVFIRSEGTTSFFVSDFTEVDDNVTRHLATELNAEDWDVMILHYLGLDHIGHVESPLSPLVRPKLQQMDRVDRDYEVPSLFLICGDHGMKNSGSHGGASLEEVLVPIIMISDAFQAEKLSVGNEYKEDFVPQIDIVPSLSILLGLPIPTTNLGKIIPQLIQSLPMSRQLYALYYNCKQVATQYRINIASAEFDTNYLQYQEAERLHAKWLIDPSDDGLDERVIKLYMSALTGMSSKLADSMLRVVHMTMIFFINIGLLILSVLWCSFSESTSLLCNFSALSAPVIFFTVVAVAFNTFLLRASTFRKGIFSQMCRMHRGQILIGVGLMLHALSFASSSLIEEEHQVWYFFWVTFVLIVLSELWFEAKSVGQIWHWLAIPFLHRVLRKWNQTGDKWASLPDIGDWLMQHQNRACLSVVLLTAAISVYCYRYAIGSVDLPFTYLQSRGVKEVRVFWSILTLLLTMGLGQVLYERKMQNRSWMHTLGSLFATLTCCWILLSALLHRPHNVLLIGVQVFISEFLHTRQKNIWWLVATHVWLGNVVYFYQGNSNSLASIDIASGYVGQTGYNPIIVGALLITNTYTAPVLSYLLLVSNLIFQNQGKGQDERFHQQLTEIHHSLILLRFLPVALYLVLLIFFRYHLFVWTVFSPKFLYEAMHSVVISFLVFFTEFLVKVMKHNLISNEKMNEQMYKENLFRNVKAEKKDM
ncbi:GPI ethanolamine phosphate transferase 2 [Blattella germanica]|nr:GPI ethanolamine phosphate transferase 2 [Blattella germanica]